MTERGIVMNPRRRSQHTVAPAIFRANLVRINILRLPVVEIERLSGKNILPRYPAATSKGIGTIHPRYQISRDGLVCFVMPGKRGQDLWAVHPLFEHFRRRLAEIRFHADAADSRPLLRAENPVHQVAKFMK